MFGFLLLTVWVSHGLSWVSVSNVSDRQWWCTTTVSTDPTPLPILTC